MKTKCPRLAKPTVTSGANILACLVDASMCDAGTTTNDADVLRDRGHMLRHLPDAPERSG